MQEEIYGIAESTRNARYGQVSNDRLRNSKQESNNEPSNPSHSNPMTDNFRTCIGNSNSQQRIQELHRNPVSSDNIPGIYGSVTPKTSRIITTLKKVDPSPSTSDAENGILPESTSRCVYSY